MLTPESALVRYTTEILQTCETGGANTFRGTWQVQVTKYPIKGSFENGNLTTF